MPADAWAADTLLAKKAGSQIALGCTIFVAEPNRWNKWLSGSQRLTMMDLASEWMRPTLQKLQCRKRLGAASRGWIVSKLMSAG